MNNNAIYWINVIAIGQASTVDIIGLVGKLVGGIQKHCTSFPFRTLNHILYVYFIIDLVTVSDAILTSRQTREKLRCLYENIMSDNFRKRAVLKKISIVN